jgi:hypothetical protein
MSNVPPRPAQIRMRVRDEMSDDLRASRAQLWRSYQSSRRWTLASLALYLVCFALALLANIVLSPVFALERWVRDLWR